MSAFKSRVVGFIALMLAWSKTVYKVDAAGIEIIRGLNDRLKEFRNCNIYLRSMDFDNTWLEPVTVPVIIDSVKRRGAKNRSRTAVTPISKYRKNVCTLDVYILSAGENAKDYVGKFIDYKRKGFDHADPSFLIFIQHHKDFIEQNDSSLTWLDDPRVLLQKMIFVWTVQSIQTSHSSHLAEAESLNELEFQSQYYYCQYCRSPNDNLVKHRTFQLEIDEEEGQHDRPSTLEQYAKKMRQHIAWNMDERDNCYCPTEVSRFNGTVPVYHGEVKDKLSLEFSRFLSTLIYPNRTALTTNIITTKYNFFDLPNFCFRGTTNIEHEISHGFFIVPVGKMGYNFITCLTGEAGNVWGKSIMYFIKFQYYIWIGIILSYFGNFLYLATLKYLGRYPHKLYPILYAMIFSLLEVPPNSTPIRTLRNNTRLRYLIAIWLLSGILLTNLYKGVNVSDYANPWQPTKWKSFLELRNFNFFTDEGTIYIFPDCHNLTEPHTGGERYHEESDDDHDHEHSQVSRFMDHLSPYFEDEFERTNASTGQVQQLSYFNMYEEIFSGYSVRDYDSATVIEKIQDCNRTAIVATSSDVDYFLTQLNKPVRANQAFYKGNENFIPQTIRWIFKDIKNAEPQLRLALLIESGIYSYWDYWLNKRPLEQKLALKKHEEASDTWAPLSTNDGEMRLIFTMFGLLMLVSILVFFAELLVCKIVKGRLTHATRKLEVALAKTKRLLTQHPFFVQYLSKVAATFN